MTASGASFVWIPRFGIKNGEEPFGGAVFKYKTTDNYVIAYETEEDYIHNKIESIVNWSNRVQFTENTLGKWCEISELSNNTSVAYYLNQSQFGPMITY